MNRTWKNAGWIISCRVVQSILSFVVSLMSARYLGPSNYGVLQYAASLVTFATPIMTLGFTNTLVHELVSDKEKEGEILGTAISSCGASSLLCILGIIFFARITNPGDSVTVIVCALYSLNLFFSAIELVQYWFHAKLLAKYTATISLAAYVLISGYRIFLLATGKSVYWFSISYALDVCLIAMSLLCVYRRLSGARFRFSFTRFKQMFTKSRYYIVSSMMVSLISQTDRVMLKHMMNDEATGLYSAAVACAGMTSFVFAAIADSFRPVIFESHLKDQQQFEINIKKLYSVMIYFSLVQCIGITLFSDLIIHLTYGEVYQAAAPALVIVVWYTTFSYLGIVRNIWILSEGKQKYLWVINMFGGIANILLNYFMIPIWGINGAAFASLLTQFFTNVIMGFILKPIRYNNQLMLQSLNPKFMIDFIKKLKEGRRISK